MKRLELVVDGKPIAWARPGQIGAKRYDTQKANKIDLGWILIEAKGKHTTPQGMIHLSVKFFLQRPKSRDKEKGEQYHACKPDLDNLVKFLLDAGNGIVWKDDSEIVEIHAEKFYSSYPRTEIVIRW